MRFTHLVLLAALPLASCVTKVGSPGSDVPVQDRSLRIPEVGEQFDSLAIAGSRRVHRANAKVLRVLGRSVLVRAGRDDIGWNEVWFDWEDVQATWTRCD